MSRATHSSGHRERSERGEILIMTLLVIVVVSITCASLLGLQWTGSQAQTTVAGVRANAVAVDSDLDAVIGIIRFDPTYDLLTYDPAAPTPGAHCVSGTTPDQIYQDDAVDVMCTPQPGGAPNHRVLLLQAYQNASPPRLLAQASIDIADVDPNTGSPSTGAVVRVRTWIEEPGQ